MTDTVILIAVALVAFVIGCGLGYYLTAGRERKADERAERVEAEMAAYRGNVTEHFRETAVKFRQLGEQYRALHGHLADGAEALCDVPDKGAKLEFSPLAELEAPRSGLAPGAAAMAASAASAANAGDAGDERDEGGETAGDTLAAVAGETEIEREAEAGSAADESGPQPNEPPSREGIEPEEPGRREGAAPATADAEAQPEPGVRAAAAESESAIQAEAGERVEQGAPKQPVDFPVDTGDAGREATEDESGRRTIH
jgi:uncharacterized membrane-anchored protein YhcB (DUF1043 family)